MKNIFLVLSSFLLLSLVSCNNEDKSQDYDKSIMPEGYSNTQTNTSGTAATVPQGNINTNPTNNIGLPNTSQQMPVVQQQVGANAAPQIIQQAAPTAVNNSTSSAKGLNPAHGAPGHRCDIPVGSPLNSAPSATVNQPQTITTSATPAAKTATAPGMNPAHGEPGHRCDISVGAPLNSKPAEVKTTSSPAMPALTPIVPAGKEISLPAKEQENKKSDQ